MVHKISHNTAKRLITADRATVIIATIFLVTAAVLLLSSSYSSQANAQNKTQPQKSGNATTTNATAKKTTGGAESAKQLSQLGVGANKQVLGNNTDIGNPNAGKAASTQEKINATTPKTGLPSNPTSKGQK